MANKSISSVEFRKYHQSPKDIYPALTVCFRNPYFTDKLKGYNVDWRIYENMLRGKEITKFQVDEVSDEEFDLFGPEETSIPEPNVTERLYSIPYANVTLGFEEDRFNIVSLFKYDRLGKYIKAKTFKPNRFLQTSMMKCFTFELESTKPISEWQLLVYTNNMIQRSLRIHIYMHFPGSFLLARKNVPSASSIGENSLFQMEFGLADVTEKRSTTDNMCEENQSNMDKMYVQKMLNNIGCIPPYLKGTFGLEEREALCTSKQMRQLYEDFDFRIINADNFLGPCRDIFALFNMKQFEPDITVRKEIYNLTAQINIDFLTEEFKYINQLPAYPAWSFMAEVGGYAGLFLGFSNLQFPDLVVFLYQSILKHKGILFGNIVTKILF